MTPDAHARLDLLLGLRRFREAEALARECLAAEPQGATWHAQLARALGGQDRLQEAAAAAQMAAGLVPDNAWVLSVLAWTLIRTDRTADALAVLREVLRLDPSFTWGHELLAAACACLGRSDEWLAAARRALELDPTEESPRLQLGWALFAHKQFSDALAVADEGLRLQPGSDGLLNLRGMCLAELAGRSWKFSRYRQFREGHDCLREALRIDPSDAAHVNNYYLVSVSWRRSVYRTWVLTSVLVLVVGGGIVGHLHYGPVAWAIAFLVTIYVLLFLGRILLAFPDYGLLAFPFHWLGLPRIALSPEVKSRGREAWNNWVGSSLAVIILLALLLAFKGCRFLVR
jgi:tetratricopeptide (TPR) repeat protein